MSKHTPGPWQALSPEQFSPMAKGFTIVGGVAPDPWTEARYLPVATVHRTKNPNPQWRQAEDMEANARLIAAAPELLEVVRMVMAARDEADRGGDHYAELSTLVTDAACAAIAKAEGSGA